MMMDWRWTLLVTLVGIYGSPSLSVDASTPEFHLQASLFANYNTNVRPVSAANKPISVNIDLFPINLKSVNEKEQTVTFNAFLLMVWQDVFLVWNPGQHSGVNVITVNPKDIWTPPIGLYNSVGMFFDEAAAAGVHARVDPSGYVQRQIMGEFTFTCDIDPTNFPYDSHTCGMQFASPSLTDAEMLLLPQTSSPLDFELYSMNGQWQIRNSSAVRDQLAPTVAAGAKYERVTFYFELARLNMFHMLNIVVPLLLTNFLVPCLFLLPADSGEKLGLGVTLLLALSVFLLTLSDSTPETSAYVPLLTIFVTIQLVLTSLSIICTTLIMRLHHNDSPNRPPKWVRTFVLGCMARCLFLGDQRKQTSGPLDEDSCATKSTGTGNSIQHLKDEVKNDGEFLGMSPGNRKLLEYLELMAQKFKDEEEASEVSEEWKKVAYVLDWLLFWIFAISILIVTIVIFTRGRSLEGFI